MGWTKFAVGEGLTKTANSLVGKFLGVAAGSLAMAAVAGVIIGIIQMISGFAGYALGKRNKANQSGLLFPDKRSVGLAIMFGLMASIFGTIWSIYTFTLGADIGVRTLLIMGSIVPGAVLDRILWRDKLTIAQLLGIAVFLVAAWAMLDFPALSMLVALPIWVPAVLVITFTQAINEALSRAASVKLSPWVNNFWVGATTIITCLIAIPLLVVISGGVNLSLSPLFVFGAIISGFLVVPMIAWKLLSYAGGGTIAMKKVIMQGTYLITAVIAGVLVYHEPLTIGKEVGTVLFFISVTLTQIKKLHPN
ncbi:MAG: hypothetical protein AAB677_01575 [Patescibacteria group bacterium]